MNFNGLILMLLAVLLLGACADTDQYRGRRDFINWANDCAVCGATVGDNYFAGSAFKAIGPGSY